MNLTQLYNGCVPPLKGHRETHAASVSYRASVPAGQGGRGATLSYRASSPDGEVLPVPTKALSNRNSVPTQFLSDWHAVSTTPPPFRHTPYRFWLQPTTSVWRNLLHCPHNDWTYTFSAKERDPETGLSYFGSRYYSSDLNIWLSVDPQSDKYASLSPYVYCADNPVKLVDPNGEEFFDDIVIHGKNKSSITIKTSLIDLDLNANVDFGGNYTLNLENVAIGFQTEFVATGQAGIGTSYGGFKSKIMFFGGDYSGYWYDYVGGDMQIVCGASVEASVGIQTSLVLGFYTGEKGGNTPESFAGAYTGLSCTAGIKAALCGLNFNTSNTKALNNKWNVFTFGISFTQGYQGGIGLSVGSEFGSAKLTTKPIPTKNRTVKDRVKNLLSH